MKENLIKLKHHKDEYLALWKVTSTQSDIHKNILLTHGTFSHKKVLNGITEFLTHHHYTCWILEWTNHGSSTKSTQEYDFETIGQQDFKIVFEYLFDICKIRTVDCITHSGGGICLTIALINQPNYQKNINSISFFACQAFGAAHNRKNYMQIRLIKYFSKLIGYVPAKKVGGEENEPYHLMRQWFQWNLRQEFKGKSGIDYKNQMQYIKIPILSIYGEGDRLIAPPIGCQMYLSAFKNSKNEMIHGAKHNGFSENYNHSRILYSRSAQKEIYPKVLAWIKKQS